MSRLTLLIADGSETFRLSLAKLLEDSYQIYHCRNGKEANRLICEHHPDVIVLDLLLTELDGISLLHNVVQNGLQPMVLATSRLLTDYVIETAEMIGVDYLIAKPCDPEAAAERVRDLSKKLRREVPEAPDPIKTAKELLISLSFSSHLRGFDYLVEAITSASLCPGFSITKVLYPQIAVHYQATYYQVERSIRTAIESAWEKRNPQVWHRYFPHNYEGEEIRPSNGAFILRLAKVLSKETD